jgi:ketosteroid isomerase-like protein
VAYLAGLFADVHFGAGRLAGAPQVSIRPVTDDVVVARTYVEIAGQQTADGKELPNRRNHSLKVLARQPDGRWLIVSEIYMDARDETTYSSGADR